MGSGAGKRYEPLLEREMVRQAQTNQAFRDEIKAIIEEQSRLPSMCHSVTQEKAVVQKACNTFSTTASSEALLSGGQKSEPSHTEPNTEGSRAEPSRQWTRSEILVSCQHFPCFAKIDALTSLDVQQTINLCNVTAVATALSALGELTTVDDMIWETGPDLASVVNDGMTLAQVFGLATLWIAKRGIDAFVRCYHFDAGRASYKGFWSEVVKKRQGPSFVWVLNFDSGIAHGKAKGGGHFSILVAALEETQELIISDVHPLKYGRYWSAPARQIFNAMVDKDSQSKRSRGLLIFGKQIPDDEEFPGLAIVGSSVSWVSPEATLGSGWLGHADELQRFVPNDFCLSRQTALNMNGASALTIVAASLDSQEWTLQEVMHESGASYTEHLRTFRSVAQICEMAGRLHGFSGARCSLEATTDEAKAASELLRALSRQITPACAALLCFDVNIACGCEIVGALTTEAGALTHGSKKWAVVAAVDVEARCVVLADPHPITMTRLWRCEAEKLVRAVKALGEQEYVLVSRVCDMSSRHSPKGATFKVC